MEEWMEKCFDQKSVSFKNIFSKPVLKPDVPVTPSHSDVIVSWHTQEVTSTQRWQDKWRWPAVAAGFTLEV